MEFSVQSKFVLSLDGGGSHLLIQLSLLACLEEETGIAGSAKMDSLDWKYSPGNPDAPVLRGEACMALFQLYFHLMGESKVDVHHISGS